MYAYVTTKRSRTSLLEVVLAELDREDWQQVIEYLTDWVAEHSDK